ncbi:hypothetical protein Bhyg_02541 [Pseudolycoriella hygida]|uniref:Uncharacterized protein n=1 Tax=Pseudolycoriella hygida TaxID=35572 RepID=A0A9Q0S6R2_9DIPT|nr:hypothetical protein Bhyg_02541 [Pseudolycoriella hygida]
MNRFIAAVLFLCVVGTSAQRAPFAGSRPNGYKDKLQTDSATNSGLDNRFGEGGTGTGTTTKLPNLALGDRDIVDRLNALPVDKQPFWLINSQAIEAQKNQGRPTTTTNQNTGEIANRFGPEPTATNCNCKPNYHSVVYPLEMTPEQRQQAQQIFNNRNQQIINSNQPLQPNQPNPLPSRIDVQEPVVTQQTIVNSSRQIPPQPVQGRLPSSGYSG